MNAMTCGTVTDFLPDRLAERLGEVDRIRIDQHLAGCADCRAQRDLLEAVRAAAVRVPAGLETRVRRAVAARPRPRRWSPAFVAVAASVVFVLAGGLFLSEGPLTGRRASDPAGLMATPSLLKAGSAAQNNIDGFGRNRWGDYSLSTLDPSDQLTMWTIQEYAEATNIWGTWVGRYQFADTPETYCTGNTNSLGCVPFVTTAGTASATSPDPFQILGNDVLPGQIAFLLYSFQKASLGFHGGTLCVKAPFQRLLPPKSPLETGNPPCSGVVKRDFNNRIQSGADPALVAGQEVNAQWLYRDPNLGDGFNDGLTNGIEFTIAP